MKEKNKGHLNLEERQIIYAMHEGGSKDSEIAKVLGRHRSVVCRERKRNRPPIALSGGLSPLDRAKYANDKAKRRVSDCKRGLKGP